MKCQQVSELLSDYIEETMSRALRVQFEMHIAECSACAHELEGVRDLVYKAYSPDVFARVEVPAQFDDYLMMNIGTELNAIAAERQKKAGTRWSLPTLWKNPMQRMMLLTGAATAMVAIILASQSFTNNNRAGLPGSGLDVRGAQKADVKASADWIPSVAPGEAGGTYRVTMTSNVSVPYIFEVAGDVENSHLTGKSTNGNLQSAGKPNEFLSGNLTSRTLTGEIYVKTIHGDPLSALKVKYVDANGQEKIVSVQVTKKLTVPDSSPATSDEATPSGQQ